MLKFRIYSIKFLNWSAQLYKATQLLNQGAIYASKTGEINDSLSTAQLSFSGYSGIIKIISKFYDAITHIDNLIYLHFESSPISFQMHYELLSALLIFCLLAF